VKPAKHHSLLERQLRQHFGRNPPENIAGFIAEIDQTYHENDRDREMVERSLELTSAEMLELNQNIETNSQYRIEVERQLHDARVKMLRSQKHEALGRLAGNVAHDFNNLLAIIRGYAEILESEATDEAHESLKQIQLATERGSGLTRQILAYTKSQTLKMEDLDLNSILCKYKSMLEVTLGRGILLQIDPIAESLRVRIDEDQFTQILLNIAANARDAMTGTGKFTISARSCPGLPAACELNDATAELKREYEAKCDGCGDGAEFVVIDFSDNGRGVSAENLPKIFEPYYTTKEMGRGTGLGLAVVYGIVKQMSGFIYCASRPGNGTTFQIRLPRIHLSTETASPEAPVRKIEIKKPADTGILVVDDETAVGNAISSMLRESGYNVFVVANPVEALIQVRTGGRGVDIVLTDFTMPGMSGKLLAKQIVLAKPRIRVILMTGNAPASVRGEDEKGFEVLRKPFHRAELLAAIERELVAIASNQVGHPISTAL
jgi:two-component system, cell cycle sensor histidine kinase and response regulator CckA